MTYLTRKKSSLIALLILLLFPALQAQEVLVPVGGNPVAKQFYQHLPLSRKAAPADTLQLPFIDDFSDSYIQPDPRRWSDQFAYVNNDYPVFPVTAGVATLDAYNYDGSEYPERRFITLYCRLPHFTAP